jgi:carboxyl-terminal processing protease
VETDRANNEVTAGDTMNLKVTVTNHGTSTLYRLLAVTKSEDPLFDGKQLAIGKLEPGKSRTVSAPAGWCDFKGHKVGSTTAPPKDAPRVCPIPKDTLMRADGVKFHFDEARGHAPPDAELRATVKSLERPVFAYSYEIIDNRHGNGDGRAQKGEGLTMYLTIRNIGKGRSFETMANLRNLSGEGLLLHDGRFDVSNMAPGESKRVAFTFDIEPPLPDPEAKVELSVRDDDLRESVVEKVRIPVVDPLVVASGGGASRAKAGGADLVNEPDATGRVFGRLPAGAGAPVLGTRSRVRGTSNPKAPRRPRWPSKTRWPTRPRPSRSPSPSSRRATPTRSCAGSPATMRGFWTRSSSSGCARCFIARTTTGRTPRRCRSRPTFRSDLG